MKKNSDSKPNKNQIEYVKAKNQKLIVIGVIIALIAILLVVIKYVFANNANSSSSVDIEVVKTELKKVDKLTTAEYTYSDIARFKSSRKILGKNIPLTQKSFIVKYQGSIEVGYDVDDIRIKGSGRNVEVALPDIKIFHKEITKTKIVDEKNNIMNMISLKDEEKIKEYVENIMLKVALEDKSSVLTQGDEKIKSIIESKVKKLMKKDGQIEFSYINNSPEEIKTIELKKIKKINKKFKKENNLEIL